jgi:post-segregation antitoxin (ccd killing protein)
MGSYVTVSTKVRKELVERARALGVNISEVLRKSLEEYVMKKEMEELEKKLKEIGETLERIDLDEVTRIIREDRETR